MQFSRITRTGALALAFFTPMPQRSGHLAAQQRVTQTTPRASATAPNSTSNANSAYDYSIIWDSSKPIQGHEITSVLSVRENDAGSIVFLAALKPGGMGIFTPDKALAV